MQNPEWLFLFFITMMIGFFLGRRETLRKVNARSEKISREYIKGLNYLLNEQPDKAVDVFLQNIEVSADTIDTHMSLARLFRKRGEIDRATVIHHSLLDNMDLPQSIRDDVEFELARDYMAGGLFDRAEIILQEFSERESAHQLSALKLLMQVFEQERDWHNALAVGDKILRQDVSVAPVLAHYCCELAERMTLPEKEILLRRGLRRALSYDPACARASVLLGRVEIKLGNTEAAIKSWQNVYSQSREHFDIVLDELVEAYDSINQSEQCNHYLASICVRKPSTALLLMLAQRLRDQHGSEAVIDLLTEYMKAKPTVKGLDKVLDLNPEPEDEATKASFKVLKSLTAGLAAKQPHYQCADCGFEAHALHWQCPSCKNWGALKPALESE